MRHFEVVKDKHRKNSGDIKLPTRATKNSIGYDFYSPISVDIEPMCSQMIWTDVKAIFENDEALLINVRSSMGKQPVMIANTQGWIENDYAKIQTTMAILDLDYSILAKPYIQFTKAIALDKVCLLST